MVQDTLLDSFRAGRRNYTIFQVGKATLLRVSDVMTLKKSDIYNSDGSVKHTAFIHDKKTDKANTLYLKPVQQDLLQYHDWLVQENINSEWLFPSASHHNRHITEKQFYKVISRHPYHAQNRRLSRIHAVELQHWFSHAFIESLK